MKGTIFTTFESFICDSFGDDMYERILEDTELETDEPFVGPGTYPAGDMMALVGTAVDKIGITVEEALAAFGRYAFPKLAAGIPDLMEQLPDARTFFTGLESVIHTEVRKLDASANPARFTPEEKPDGTLLLHYESPLGLLALVGGFIDGVGEWYGEALHHEIVAVDGTNATFSVTFASQPHVGAHAAPAAVSG